MSTTENEDPSRLKKGALYKTFGKDKNRPSVGKVVLPRARTEIIVPSRTLPTAVPAHNNII